MAKKQTKTRKSKLHFPRKFERMAIAEREANARAQREGRPLPYPNPWDVLDPTKAPENATQEEILESYRRFKEIYVELVPEKNLSLEDYGELLQELCAAGFSFAVIGGCAIGVYARERGKNYLSMDLDLYSAPQEIRQITDWLRKRGVKVIHTPVPREVPVTILEWRGLRIDLLYRASALSDPQQLVQSARAVVMKEYPDLEVLIADPFELLREKLKLNRDKDKPHVPILLEFVEAEILEALRTESHPRERIEPAQRLLWATDAEVLSLSLFRQMLPLARTPTDFRFLTHSAPSKRQTEVALQAARATCDEATVEHLRDLARTRKYPRKRAARRTQRKR